jgi:hypothetical protein
MERSIIKWTPRFHKVSQVVSILSLNIEIVFPSIILMEIGQTN